MPREQGTKSNSKVSCSHCWTLQFEHFIKSFTHLIFHTPSFLIIIAQLETHEWWHTSFRCIWLASNAGSGGFGVDVDLARWVEIWINVDAENFCCTVTHLPLGLLLCLSSTYSNNVNAGSGGIGADVDLARWVEIWINVDAEKFRCTVTHLPLGLLLCLSSACSNNVYWFGNTPTA